MTSALKLKPKLKVRKQNFFRGNSISDPTKKGMEPKLIKVAKNRILMKPKLRAISVTFQSEFNNNKIK